VISGAITEFDRGGATQSQGFNLSTIFGGGKGTTDAGASLQSSVTMSRIAVDFNLIDFRTQQMLSQIQAKHRVEVRHENRGSDASFGIMGTALGASGSSKYVQGRHAALRTLVELNVLQTLGRYINVPYWRLLPDGSPDEVVLSRLMQYYVKLMPDVQIKAIQEVIQSYGQPVEMSGRWDAQTQAALSNIRKAWKGAVFPELKPSSELYLALYLNVPMIDPNPPVATVKEMVGSRPVDKAVAGKDQKPSASRASCGSQLAPANQAQCKAKGRVS
jgi:hypothetical protein